MSDNIDSKRLQQIAIKVAIAGGDATKGHFRNSMNTHSEKDAKSAIVTVADIEAETEMRVIIEKYFPDHSIQGEELQDKVCDSDYKWVLDPIDGTSNFVMGKPIFGTLVALFKNDKPVLGIIYQPILNELFIAIEGEKTFFNGKEIHTSDTDILSNSLAATNPPYMFEANDEQRVLWGLHKDTRSMEFGGDCYNYAMLANGNIDIVLISGDDFHDFAAIIPIVKGAGGVISDWEGNELTPQSTGHILATANPKLHRIALERISQFKAEPTSPTSTFQRTNKLS